MKLKQQVPNKYTTSTQLVQLHNKYDYTINTITWRVQLYNEYDNTTITSIKQIQLYNKFKRSQLRPQNR